MQQEQTYTYDEKYSRKALVEKDWLLAGAKFYISNSFSKAD